MYALRSTFWSIHSSNIHNGCLSLVVLWKLKSKRKQSQSGPSKHEIENKHRTRSIRQSEDTRPELGTVYRTRQKDHRHHHHHLERGQTWANIDPFCVGYNKRDQSWCPGGSNALQPTLGACWLWLFEKWLWFNLKCARESCQGYRENPGRGVTSIFHILIKLTNFLINPASGGTVFGRINWLGVPPGGTPLGCVIDVCGLWVSVQKMTVISLCRRIEWKVAFFGDNWLRSVCVREEGCAKTANHVARN